MSFKDIINAEQKKVEAESGGGNNTQVQYPQTKHQRLFFGKENPELWLQILPSSDIVSRFAVPVRKIFLNTVSSQGKQINSNFTLDPDKNYGSLLENKIDEWTEQGIIPARYGGQQKPSRKYLVNVVLVVQQNGQFVQERDNNGDLVVRVLELPQSAYSNVIAKLQDSMYNFSGTEMSFMDINKPNAIRISKPPQGKMEYTVDVHPQGQLPPLGQGWENQLEDLNAQGTPTERLENGDQWVEAFVDMKEGRKPNQNKNQQSESPSQPQTQTQTQTNPYAQVQGQVQGQQQFQHQQSSANNNPFEEKRMEDYAGFNAPPQQPNQNPSQPQTQTQGQGQGQTQQQFPNVNPNPTMNQNQGHVQGQGQGQGAPKAPPQQNQNQNQQPDPTAGVETNHNDFMDIDAMLERELNGNN